MSSHIVSDPEILAGKPVIRGTRLSVEFLLELLASGASRSEVLESYPELSAGALDEALRYAARCVSNQVVWDMSLRA